VSKCEIVSTMYSVQYANHSDSGPRLWNSLPISLRKISSYGQFRRYLINHLFGIWEITVQCDAWLSALYKYSYLLTYLLKWLAQFFSFNRHSVQCCSV